MSKKYGPYTPKYTEEQKDFVLQHMHLTIPQLCEELKICKHKIIQIRKDCGVATNTHKVDDPEVVDYIIKSYPEKSSAVIGKELNISKFTVLRILHAYNIATPGKEKRSEALEDFILNNPDKTFADVRDIFDTSETTVYRIRSYYGLCRYAKSFDAKMDFMIKRYYPTTDNDFLANKLGVSVKRLRARAKLLGVIKSKEWIRQRKRETWLHRRGCEIQ